MRLRPLAIVVALVAIDYAVWNWSLGGGRDVAGMISGLTLPPLLAALLLLVALNAFRALGSATRRPLRPPPPKGRARRIAARRSGRRPPFGTMMKVSPRDPTAAPPGQSSSSTKIAA